MSSCSGEYTLLLAVMFGFSGVLDGYSEGELMSVDVVVVAGTLQRDVTINVETFHISTS